MYVWQWIAEKVVFFLIQVEGPGHEELSTLHDSVYHQSVSWFTSLQDHMKEQILSHFGLMPDREPEPQVCRPPPLHGAETQGADGELGHTCCAFDSIMIASEPVHGSVAPGST